MSTPTSEIDAEAPPVAPVEPPAVAPRPFLESSRPPDHSEEQPSSPDVPETAVVVPITTTTTDAMAVTEVGEEPSKSPPPETVVVPVAVEKAAAEPAKEGKEEAPKPPRVPFFRLFRFATAVDKLLMVVGTLAAGAMGCGLPAFAFAFGQLLDDLAGNPSEMTSQVATWCLIMTLFGVGCWVLASIGVSFWIVAGENQLRKLRTEFFAAVLRQEVGWFDTTKTGELSSRLSADTQLVQAIMSEKMANLIQYSCCFVASL
eukprot:RCo053809